MRRCSDGAVVREATADDVARSARTARRELSRYSGAPEPGLGVIYAEGFRCWVEPPVLLVA